MNSQCRFLAYLFCLSASLTSMKANGATIIWGVPQDITGASDVLDSSEYVRVHEAYNVDDDIPGANTVTLNGVVFTAGRGGVPNTLGYNGFATVAAPVSGDYRNFLTHGRYGSVNSITLGSGTALAVGQDYRVQIWINDSRSFGNTRTTTFTAGSFVDVSQNQGSTDSLGHWVTGAFTADAATQVISVSDNQLINGYAVYLPAEPPVVKKAYWQLDDSTGSGEFLDAYDPGTYTLKSWSGTQSASVAIHPIPNPDAGPFSAGDPTNNPYSGISVRGNTYAPVTAFNMSANGSWTFEGWFRRTGSDVGFLAGTRGMESGGDGWELFHISDGRLDFRMVNGGVVEYGFNSGTNRLALSIWHHVALTWHHDAGLYGEVMLFLDGNPIAVNASSGIDDSEAKAFYVGGRDWTSNGVFQATQWYFNGYMDELRFSEGAPDPNPQFLIDSSWSYPTNLVSGGWMGFQAGTPRGLAEIADLKSAAWDSPDTDWAKWAVVYVGPTRIYYDDWTDAQRLDYIQEFDPDVAGFWAGASMNRGEFLRRRGVAELSCMEYEYQESIGPMNSYAEPWFTGNGLAVKEDGSVALRAPWYVPYMSVIAPKWKEIVRQGIWRQAMYGDGIWQDNVGITTDGVDGGNYNVWENHFFKDYLNSHFSSAQHAEMGLPDVNQYEVRDDLAGKRPYMSNRALTLDPVIHEYVRFSFLEHIKTWVDMAEQAKQEAKRLGKEIPLLAGHQSGSWGTHALSLALCGQVDVILPEMSALRQPPFYDEPQKQAESSFFCKAARAAGHFERPAWISEVAVSSLSDQLRVVPAVVHSEIHANGCVPLTDSYNTPDANSPRWAAQAKHARFVSQNRHLFTDRTSLADIALIESFPSLFWRDFSSLSDPLRHWDHLNAASRLLEDNHLLYDVSVLGHPDLYDDSGSLARLSNYEMLILPNVDCISDSQVSAIEQFVTNGGTLVLWHETGIFDEEMADRTEPAFDDLKSNPGAGEVIVVSEALAEDYRTGSASAESQIMALIQPSQPLVETTLPETVWANAWEYGAGPMKAVHMVNYDVNTNSDTVALVSNFTLKLACTNTVAYTHAVYYTPDCMSASTNWPAPQSLALTKTNGYLEVTVPELKVYGIVVFSAEDELDARATAGQARKWHERLKLACRSQGQDIASHSNLLSQSEGLLSQIQGDVVVSDFSSLIAPLDTISTQLEAQMESVTAEVENLQTTNQNEAVNVAATYRFDFGEAGAPPGWTAISETTSYTASPGYGWTSISYSTAVDTQEPDLLHRDFIRSRDPAEYLSTGGNNQFRLWEPASRPATFRVDLPNGDYVVTLITGDYTEMSMTVGGSASEGRVGNTYVEANGKSVLYGDRLYSGYFDNRAFEVQVTDGFLELTFWGENVGPSYHNSIEWLVNGLIIQATSQTRTAGAQKYLDRADLLNGGAIRSWLAIGPFDDGDCRGMETAYGPETDSDPDLMWPGKNGTIYWQAQTLADPAPYVRLSSILGDTDEVAAYGQSHVYCPSAIAAKLVYSTSQTGVGWVNGTEVFRDEMATGLLLEEGSVDIALQQGWNAILIKSMNHWGSEWSLHASLLDAGGTFPLAEIPGVVVAARTNEIAVDTIAVSYWQMDDWSERTVFADAVGTNHLKSWSHTQSAAGLAGADPIPNPDAGPFNEGHPLVNTFSCRNPRGNTPEPVDAFNMTTNASWTFEGWFCRTGGGTGFIAGTRGLESGGDGWEMYHPTGSGRLDFRMLDGAVNDGSNSGTNELILNTWHHVALVWDHDEGSFGEIRIYLDGILVANKLASQVYDSSPKAFYIGGRDWLSNGEYKYNGWEFSGYMDELRFSPKAFDPWRFLNAAGGHYSAWINQYGAGAETNMIDNPDGDILNNLSEWGIGGDPTNPADIGWFPRHAITEIGGTNWFEYIYARRNDAAALRLAYYLEHTTNLLDDSWTNANYAVVGTGALDADFDTVTNRVATDAEPVQFLKLIIETN